MSDLINRDELLNDLRSLRITAYKHDSIVYLSKAVDDFIHMTAMAPKVDAELVVRCKHCKYAVNEPYKGEDVWICERTPWSRAEGRRNENGFCSYGEKKAK